MSRSGLIYGFLLSVVILTGGAWLLVPFLLPRSEIAEDRVATTIGQLRLTVPAAYLRPGTQSLMPGDPLDIVMTYPGLEPVNRAQPERDTRLLIFMKIERMDGVIDPAERISTLYGRFLDAGTFEHPGGLVLRRFEAGSPYAGEELYVAPPDGSTFHARCPTERSGSGIECLWRMRQEQADITTRMAPELLPHWEEISVGIQAKLKEWSGR
jgi:hypothetical protein